MRQSNTVGVQAVARGPARWYVLDGLGSVVAEVDPAGNVTASEKYDAYGSLRGGSGGGTATTHHFVGSLGHRAEAGTGLVYMRARYYDPAQGRFQSEDPARDGANWLAYCDNDPINKVDASGKAPYSMYGAGAAIGWFLYLTTQFIKADNTANQLNDIKYLWGMVTTALIYYSANPVGVGNGLQQAVRDIAKTLESARGIPYATTMTAAIAGYSLTLLFVTAWCSDFEDATTKT